jgi:inhibitor of the pro-sigma K processing machinery
MSNEYGTMIAYVLGAVFLLILGRFFLVRMKIVFKLLYNFIIGGIVLLLTNYVGSMFGFHIAFNIVTSLVVGILGLPGMALLVVLNDIFGL